jgi:hypothetical protein
VTLRRRRIGRAIRYHTLDSRAILASSTSAIRAIDGLVPVIFDGIFCGNSEGM